VQPRTGFRNWLDFEKKLRIMESTFPSDLRPPRRRLYRNHVRPLPGRLAAHRFSDIFGQPL
jgi:hypothetical protein